MTNPVWFIGAILLWLAAWASNEWLVRHTFASQAAKRMSRMAVPLLFGLAILALWEGVVRGFSVPPILLPAPSAILARLLGSLPILWADFRQTFLKSVLTGYVLGCGLGFIVAILIDRSPFLQRGLLPIGNFVSALPVVGIAPIMVMWFGFDWQSKVAVVVIMTFFPMLVNTVQGLAASSHMERDLMRTYAAGWGQNVAETAPARRLALHLQRAEDQFHTGADRRHRRGILRHAHRRHGFPHLGGNGPQQCRYGLGRNRCSGARRLRILRSGGAHRARRHLLASVRPWGTNVNNEKGNSDENETCLHASCRRVTSERI